MIDNEDEEKIEEEALKYVIEHKEELIKKFILDKRPVPVNFLTFFMAGSPGAGKTEFARRYVEVSLKKQFSKIKKDKKIVKLFREAKINLDEYDRLFISIDVDAIREFLPQYKKTDRKKGIKGNAHVVQRAANNGLDILRRYCLDNNISFLHDGTFGNQYSTLRKLIKKSLKLNRNVQIFYIYMDPKVAWKFTQEREYLEGRNIKKNNFIVQFYQAMENIERAKTEFGNKIILTCILKEEKKNIKKIEFNQLSIANFLKEGYNNGTIKKYTEEELKKEL